MGRLRDPGKHLCRQGSAWLVGSSWTGMRVLSYPTICYLVLKCCCNPGSSRDSMGVRQGCSSLCRQLLLAAVLTSLSSTM